MAAQATIISVIAARAGDLSAAADAVATNVHAVAEPDDDHDVNARLQEVKRKPPVYVLAPFDPLRALMEAWADRLAGSDSEFELTAGALTVPDLPDYYIVDEHVAEPARSWYFELLYNLAPARIAAFDGTVDGLLGAIRARNTGRALPDIATIAAEARTFVPGTTGLVRPEAPRRVHVL